MSRPFLTASLITLAACRGGGDGHGVSGETGSSRPAAGPAAPVVQRADLARPCPSTGLWTPCTVMERLDRAGLAPRLDSAPAHEDPLTEPGLLVHLGSAAELRLFLYADSAARAADEARLEKGRYIEATAEPTLRGEATVMRTANLLAILRSRNETQRERVSLALTAGPPQGPPEGATKRPAGRR